MLKLGDGQCPFRLGEVRHDIDRAGTFSDEVLKGRDLAGSFSRTRRTQRLALVTKLLNRLAGTFAEHR